MTELKPCPFCEGEAEMDTRQSFLNFATGRPETGIAIYCFKCGAQQMICRGDVPDVEPEHVIELWNTRPALSPAPRGEDERLREALKEVLAIAELYVPVPLSAPGFRRAREALSAAAQTEGEG